MDATEIVTAIPIVDYLWFGCPFCGGFPAYGPLLHGEWKIFHCDNQSCNKYLSVTDRRSELPFELEHTGPKRIVRSDHPARAHVTEQELSEVRLCTLRGSKRTDRFSIVTEWFYGETDDSIKKLINDAIEGIALNSNLLVVDMYPPHELVRILSVIRYADSPGAPMVPMTCSLHWKQILHLPRNLKTRELIDFPAQINCLKWLASEK